MAFQAEQSSPKAEKAGVVSATWESNNSWTKLLVFYYSAPVPNGSQT